MAIAFVNGGSVSFTTSTTATVTYTPTTGNAIIVYVGTSSSAPTMSVVDNNNNPLKFGVIATNSGSIQAFYGSAASGATSYKVTIGSSKTGWMLLLEYSGVISVNDNLTVNTATGSSTTPSITSTTLYNNSWLTIGIVNTATISWTATTGNLRINTTSGSSTARSASMDNTVATAGSLTCACIKSTANTWAIVALELNADDIRELPLTGCGV